MGARHRICRVADVPPGGSLRVEIADHPPVAVFNVAGEYFATDDTCTHGKASLADGYLEGDEIECPWHGGRFCVRTGKAKSLPASEPVQTYAVEIEGDELFIR